MKRLNIFISFAIIILSLAACDTSFSKIKIKASPSLYVPLGNKELIAEEFISAEKIKEAIGTDSMVNVYKYTAQDVGSTLTYLIHYPLLEVPLDFKAYLEDLDISELASSIPETYFNVPSLENIEVAPQTVCIERSKAFAGTQLTSEAASVIAMEISNYPQIPISDRGISITGEGLKSVTMADGNNISLTLTPNTQGFTYTPQITATLTTGETVDFIANGNSYVADFSGKTIEPGVIKLSGVITVSGNVQEGIIVPWEGIGASLDIYSDMNHGYSSATVEVPANTELSKTQTNDLPDSVKNIVQEIKFLANTAGAKVTMEHNFPAGNDITVKVDSAALGVSSVGKKFNPGTSTEQYTNGSELVLKPAETNAIDVSIQVELPDYDSVSNTFTVTNILPGETYWLKGNVDMVADWSEATIIPDKTFNGVFPANTEEPMDFKETMKKIPEGISFSKIEAFLVTNSPLGNELSFDGQIEVNETYLLGTENTKENLPVKDNLTLPESAKWASAFTKDMASADISESFGNLVNSRPETLSMEFTMTTTGSELTITPEDLEGENPSIKTDLIIKMPFSLEINGTEYAPNQTSGNQYAKLDLFQMAEVYSDEEGSNNDLFNRSEAPESDEQPENLLEQITSMVLEINYNNLLGFPTLAEFYDQNTNISQAFTMTSGEGTAKIQLTKDDIKKMNSTYPFSPRIYIYLQNTAKDNPCVMANDAGIKVKLFAAAVTDINYTYNLKDEEGDE